jgi:alpha-beta hydrolase superfamily lysophospholipase
MNEEKNFFTSVDGTRLHLRSWEKKSGSALFIIHGLGEHSGRYERFVSAISDLNLSVYAVDLRGHGASEGSRVFVQTFEHFSADLIALRQEIERRRGKKYIKCVLLGHSMGGLIAADVVLREQARWCALVLLSPFFAVPLAQRPLVWICSLLDLIAPRHIWHNPVAVNLLTHDQEEQVIYSQDDIVEKRVSVHLAQQMFQTGRKIFSRAPDIMIPLLVLAAGDDQIASTRRTIAFFKRVSSKAKQIKVYDGAYHELLHERNKKSFFDAIRNYLTSLGL